MSVNVLESVAEQVLSRYRPGTWTRTFLGNAGGFSGARLWRVDSEIGSFSLKAWPAEKPAASLEQVHRWMEIARGAGRPFVPKLVRTIENATYQMQFGRIWDLTEWMAGSADFWPKPSADRIREACVAVAQLHDAWSVNEVEIGTCPAIRRRLDALDEWTALINTGWRPRFESGVFDPIAAVARRAWDILPAPILESPPRLERFAQVRLQLQPCLCDIWHDHVLFAGDRVAGIIDYGSMRIDSPATDLARLLGSLAGDDEALFAAGLEAYRSIRRDSTPDVNLIRLLDRSGTIVAITQWLRWLYRESRQYDDRQAVARRLGQLVNRLTPRFNDSG